MPFKLLPSVLKEVGTKFNLKLFTKSNNYTKLGRKWAFIPPYPPIILIKKGFTESIFCKALIFVVPRARIELARGLAPRDFKSINICFIETATTLRDMP